MQVILVLFVIFGVLLAPAQEIQISDLKDLGGRVEATQDGLYLYLSGPVGTEFRVNGTVLVVEYSRIQVVGNDDPWWVAASSGGVFKIPSERLGAIGAGEIVVAVRQPSGEFVDHKVENIAGKVTLLPGNTTLVDGQPLYPTTVMIGAPTDVAMLVGFGKYVDLTKQKKVKSTALSGAVVTQYEDGIRLPPGDWKVQFWAQNKKGVFSDTINVKVIPVQRLTECCPDILK